MADLSFNDTAPGTQRVISPKLRFSVFRRDKFRCCYCGAAPDETELRVDHIYPVASGGTDHIDNLITACAPCNAGKSDTVDNELIDVMQAKARDRNAMAKPVVNTKAKKPVTIRGVEYQSINAASEAVDVVPAMIRKAMRKGQLDGVGLRRLGVSPIDDPITIRGVGYRNASCAAQAFGVKVGSVLAAIARGRPDYIGVMSNRGKPCTIDGVEYPSVRAAATSLGISYHAAWHRSHRKPAIDYSFEIDGVKYATLSDACKRLRIGRDKAKKAKEAGALSAIKHSGKEVTVRGVTYPSIRRCAAAIGVSVATLNEAIRMGKLERVGIGKVTNKIDPFGNKMPIGVFWSRHKERYGVSMRLNGKPVQRCFTKLDDAITYVDEMRNLA